MIWFSTIAVGAVIFYFFRAYLLLAINSNTTVKGLTAFNSKQLDRINAPTTENKPVNPDLQMINGETSIGESGDEYGNTVITVVIPVLREADTLCHTMEYFLSIIKDHPQISVWIIASERELIERDKAVQTLHLKLQNRTFSPNEDIQLLEVALPPDKRSAFLDLCESAPKAQEYLHKHKRELSSDVALEISEKYNNDLDKQRFAVHVAPENYQRKVGQLNYAYEIYSTNYSQPTKHEYIATYDADSAPHPKVFAAVIKILESFEPSPTHNQPAAVYQQVSCFCKNLPTEGGFLNYCKIADAIAQTRWSLGFEYNNYVKYANCVENSRTRNLAYCVGHGCFVSIEFLNRIGGFPEESLNDDLALGYLASAMGEQIVPIPNVDFCDVAPNPFASIKQAGFWYGGSSRFNQNIATFIDKFSLDVSFVQRIYFSIQGHGRNLAWAWRGFLMLFALIVAVALQSKILIILLLIAYVLYVHIGFLETYYQLKALSENLEIIDLDTISGPTLWLSCLAAGPMFFIRSIGPLLGSLGLGEGAQAWKTDR